MAANDNKVPSKESTNRSYQRCESESPGRGSSAFPSRRDDGLTTRGTNEKTDSVGCFTISLHQIRRILVTIACLLLAERACTGQPLDPRIRNDAAKMQDWYAERDKLWDVLVRDAGKPTGGAIMELRLLNSVGEGEFRDLVVSVKNVSNRVVQPRGSTIQPYADVLIRDSAGRTVRFSDEGVIYFSQQLSITVLSNPDLKPGHARGFVVPLRKYFKLSGRGAYTVMARNYYDFGADNQLVATPITMEIGNGQAAARNKKAFQSPSVISPDNAGLSGEANKEWAGFLSKAGQLQRGCVLEALMSPAEPANLVASLTCLSVSPSAACLGDWQPGNGWWDLDQCADGRADAGRQAGDYRVLVRGPDGEPIQLTPFGRQAIGTVEEEQCSRLKKYSAIGAVIPLAKWFDLKKPGDYTVLVTLKATDEKWHNLDRSELLKRGLPAPAAENEHGPLWVEKPIKFRVPITPK